jgi:hypothetical protein
MSNDQPTPSFTVVQSQISIFKDGARPDFLDGLEDGQRAVYISIGPGETHVAVVDEMPSIRSSWTAIFGWSSLCGLRIRHRDELISPDSQAMIAKALRGSLKRYGHPVDTDGFIAEAEQRFRTSLAYIMDQTIGEGSEFDKIIFSAPEWLIPALAKSHDLRPHIDPEIHDT